VIASPGVLWTFNSTQETSFRVAAILGSFSSKSWSLAPGIDSIMKNSQSTPFELRTVSDSSYPKTSDSSDSDS